VLSWDEVGCAVLSTGDRPAESELVVAGCEGPLIRTGLCAPEEELAPLLEEIEAQLAQRPSADEGRDAATAERAALRRLLVRVGAPSGW
jgi:hypothetical protein